MISIRPYDEARDARDVGILIADTFFAFNLGRFSPEDQYGLLGPSRLCALGRPPAAQGPDRRDDCGPGGLRRG